MTLAFDVVVVGGGHAGCEAALAAARMGCQVCLVTLNIDKIALMPCNPAVGGVGKGQLTREIDALGGQQGIVTDRSFVQIKLLNTSKGPAVRALRAQTDKRLYEDWMKFTLTATQGLRVVQGEAASIDVSRETIRGVCLADGRYIRARAVVLACGTFLRGKVVVGDHAYPAGRVGELPALRLSQSLAAHGLELGRFQSATPPRIDGRTIDISKMAEQPGDPAMPCFSHWERPRPRRQLPCYLTYTTPKTHEVVASHLHLSPIKTGSVSGKGPRYCPSIDRKVINFPDKERHPVFVEPEGASTWEMYLQGLTTSMPVHVQEIIIHTVPGLERARLVRPGYAVEYDYLPSYQLRHTLETKAIRGLFAAGQINGTSGYEEAAAQGLVAGINAALYVKDEEPFVLRRDQAYIGVLIDDLVTKEIDEPYRMFTSRAEYRLLLRHDNAAERLSPIGHRLGLISDEQLALIEERQRRIEEGMEFLSRLVVKANPRTNMLLESLGSSPLSESQPAHQLLRRPELTLEAILTLVDGPDAEALRALPAELWGHLETRIRYDGYIRRQLAEIRRREATEHLAIPQDIDYQSIEGLTIEARQKLARFRPATLGQASRIAGVSPADLALLMIHVHRKRAARAEAGRGAGSEVAARGKIKAHDGCTGTRS